jgi:pimeloyl-ACP methyl ester carboxylesterase
MSTLANTAAARDVKIHARVGERVATSQPADAVGGGGGGSVAERTVEANGVGLCTEPFGVAADPPVLLVMGVGGSMLWWEDGFCRLLAEGGRS